MIDGEGPQSSSNRSKEEDLEMAVVVGNMYERILYVINSFEGWVFKTRGSGSHLLSQVSGYPFDLHSEMIFHACAHTFNFLCQKHQWHIRETLSNCIFNIVTSLQFCFVQRNSIHILKYSKLSVEYLSLGAWNSNLAHNISLI